MNFLATLLAILNEEEEVPGIPACIVLGPQLEGEIISKNLPDNEIMKIARLMALIEIENERSGIPDDENVGFMVIKDTSGSAEDFLSNCIAIRRDSTNRIAMLEGLIVEVVRKAIPTECDRLNVMYLLTPDTKLVRFPFPQHTHSD